MKKTILAITMAGFIAIAGAAGLVASCFFDPVEAKAQTVEAEEDDSFHVGVKIVTPYYSIETPAEWMGKCEIRTVDNFTGMWLKLFNIESGGFHGHLFSILLTDNEDYKIIPDNELVGELEDAAGNIYHVVAVYPTDVQYSREGRDEYMVMIDEADAILGSIEAAEGCVYTPNGVH